MYTIKKMAERSLKQDLLEEFLDFANKKLEIDQPYSVYFVDDKSNAADPLGKTAMYNPSTNSVYVYATNRHPKDILRSIAHELMHHKQNCDGRLDKTYGEGSDNLEILEREANEAGYLVREFEDGREDTNESVLKEQEYEIPGLGIKLRVAPPSEVFADEPKRQLPFRKRDIQLSTPKGRKQFEKDFALINAFDYLQKLGTLSSYVSEAEKSKVKLPANLQKLTKQFQDEQRSKSDRQQFSRTGADYTMENPNPCKATQYQVGRYCYPKGFDPKLIGGDGKPANLSQWSLNDIIDARKAYGYWDSPINFARSFDMSVGESEDLKTNNRNNPFIPIRKNIVGKLIADKTLIREMMRGLLLFRIADKPKGGAVDYNKKVQAYNDNLETNKKKLYKWAKIVNTPPDAEDAVDLPGDETNIPLNEQKIDPNFRPYGPLETNAAYLVGNLLGYRPFRFSIKSGLDLDYSRLPDKLRNEIVNLAKSKGETFQQLENKAFEIFSVSPWSKKSARAIDARDEAAKGQRNLFLSLVGGVPARYLAFADIMLLYFYAEDYLKKNPDKGFLDLFDYTQVVDNPEYTDFLLQSLFVAGFSPLKDDLLRTVVTARRAADINYRIAELTETLEDVSKIRQGVEATETFLGRTRSKIRSYYRQGFTKTGTAAERAILEERIMSAWGVIEDDLRAELEALRRVAENTEDLVNEISLQLRQGIVAADGSREAIKLTNIVDNIRSATVKINGIERPWWVNNLKQSFIDENLKFIQDNFTAIKNSNPAFKEVGTYQELAEIFADNHITELFTKYPKMAEQMGKRYELLATSLAQRSLEESIYKALKSGKFKPTEEMKSGILSKNDIKTLATDFINKTPDLKQLTQIEQVKNISKNFAGIKTTDFSNPKRYHLAKPPKSFKNTEIGDELVRKITPKRYKEYSANPETVPEGYELGMVTAGNNKFHYLKPIRTQASVSAADSLTDLGEKATKQFFKTAIPDLVKLRKVGAPFSTKARLFATPETNPLFSRWVKYTAEQAQRETGILGRLAVQNFTGNNFFNRLLTNTVGKIATGTANWLGRGQMLAKGFNYIFTATDYVIKFSIFKFSFYLLMYARFYGPLCNVTGREYFTYISKHLYDLFSGIGVPRFDTVDWSNRENVPGTMERIKQKTSLGFSIADLEAAEQELGTNLLLREKMPNALCKDVVNLLKEEPQVAQAWINVWNSVANDVAVEAERIAKITAEKAKKLKAKFNNKLNDFNATFENDPDVKKAKELTVKLKGAIDKGDEKQARKLYKEIQVLSNNIKQKRLDELEKMANEYKKDIPKVVQESVKPLMDRIKKDFAEREQRAKEIFARVNAELGAEKIPEEEPTEPPTGATQTTNESISISDYRQKILEDRLVKLTIGFTK
jgi:hypothetical protein